MELNEPFEGHEHATTSLKVVLLVFAIVLVGALAYLIQATYSQPDVTEEVAPTVKNKTEETATADTAADEMEGWETYTSTAQRGSVTFKHPDNYIVSENTDGFITIKNSEGELIADLTAATGTVPTNTAFITNTANDWFSKVEAQQDVRTTEGISGRKITGIFGSKAASFNNAEPNGSMNGKTGTTYILTSTSVIVINIYSADTASKEDLELLVNSLTQK